MATQTVNVKFTDIAKSATARIDAICLVRGAYIDGTLFTDGFSFTLDVPDRERGLLLKVIGKEELLDDALAFQAYCVGSNFRAITMPELKKVEGFEALEALEIAVNGVAYDWEAEPLHVKCDYDMNREGSKVYGYAELTVNGVFKIEVAFDLDEEGDSVQKYNFNGLTLVDVATKVVHLSSSCTAVLITTFAGGKKVENSFFC